MSFRDELVDSTSKVLGSIMMSVSLSLEVKDYDIRLKGGVRLLGFRVWFFIYKKFLVVFLIFVSCCSNSDMLSTMTRSCTLCACVHICFQYTVLIECSNCSYLH